MERGDGDEPDTGSKERTLLMLPKLSTTSSPTGTLPPTSPVFPPCGTRPMPRSLQCRTILLTSSVVRGLSTVVARPWYFPIQSALYCAIASGPSEKGAIVDIIEVRGRKEAKWSRSEEVREVRLRA